MISNINEKQPVHAPISNESLLEAQRRHGEESLEAQRFRCRFRDAQNHRGNPKVRILQALVIFTALYFAFNFVRKYVHFKFVRCHDNLDPVTEVCRLQSAELHFLSLIVVL